MGKDRDMTRGDTMREMAKLQAQIDLLRKTQDEQSRAEKQELQRQINDLWLKVK